MNPHVHCSIRRLALKELGSCLLRAVGTASHVGVQEEAGSSWGDPEEVEEE